MTPEEFQVQALIKTLESATIDVELDNSAFMFHGIKCYIESLGGIIQIKHAFRFPHKPVRNIVFDFINQLNKHIPFGNVSFINGSELLLRISLFAASPNTLRWAVRQALCLLYMMADILPPVMEDINEGCQHAVDTLSALMTDKETDDPNWTDFIKMPDQYVVSHMESEYVWFRNLTIPMYEMDNGVDYVIADDWDALDNDEEDEDEEEPDFTALPLDPPTVFETVTQHIVVDCGGQNGESDGTDNEGDPTSEGV